LSINITKADTGYTNTVVGVCPLKSSPGCSGKNNTQILKGTSHHIIDGTHHGWVSALCIGGNETMQSHYHKQQGGDFSHKKNL
jgi:hypothetical protein